MIRVADYIAKLLVESGVKHIFMLTGGGAMHLNDALGLEKKLEIIYNEHEQGCAIAAEGYARISGKPAVVCVTSGPGGTNTITGVLGQWTDSIPVLYISGQVRYDTTVGSTGLPLRQLGDQEANIIKIVEPITKYAVMVTDPKTIKYHLLKAIKTAVSGRPGPVWVDIPLNIQSSIIDEKELVEYQDEPGGSSEDISILISTVFERLKEAERPVILAGSGIRISGASEAFYELAEALNIPIQVAWNAIDLFPSDHRLYAGRPSTLGQRGANFIFQNADLILSIGCRLNLRQIGYTYKAVGRAAYKIVVDIDPAELKKPTLSIDLPIQADARIFITEMLKASKKNSIPPKNQWLDWCKQRLDKYPVVLKEYYHQKSLVNPYVFAELLSRECSEKEVIVSSNGSSCVIPIQAMKIQKGQRHIVNSGCASMGYGLPAAIGACIANNRQRVICLEGDGSIQLNIQELETIVFQNLPVKIFIFNNNGYLSIRTTQNNFFNGHFFGEGPRSGVGIPNFGKIGRAYGIKTYQISTLRNIRHIISQVLCYKGPVICDVKVNPDQLFNPRTSSKRLEDGRMISSPLEDMYPFLNDQEFLSNMIIPKWK